MLFLHGFAWQYGGLHFGRVATIFLKTTQPGSLGVDLFFVLSGFLITGILLDSKQNSHYYTRFYTRRALRILPIYYTLLLLLLILHSSSLQFVVLSFLYLANMTNFFGVSCDYGPLWSLAVEEHYYFLWPIVVRNVSKQRLMQVSILIMAVVPVLRYVCFRLNWGRGSLDWYTWFVADGLATGSFIAVLLRIRTSRNFAKKLCIWFLSVAFVLGFAGRPFGIATRQLVFGATFQQTTVNLFFGGILLLFLLIGTGNHRRFVNNSTLRFFGYISYGLYLNHLLAFRVYDRVVHAYWPTLLPTGGHFELVLLKFVMAAGAAILAAYLSRRFFEERFLQLKDRIWWAKAKSDVLLPVPVSGVPAA